MKNGLPSGCRKELGRRHVIREGAFLVEMAQPQKQFQLSRVVSNA
jgi:hypothetical protein